MWMRRALATVLAALSLHLAFVPLAGVLGTDAQRGPNVVHSAAAKDDRQTTRQNQAAARAKGSKAANKKQKQRRKQKQARAKQERQTRQRDARKRSQRAAQQELRAFGEQGPAPQVSGGALPGGQREVARLEAQGQDPGERYLVVFSNERANSRVVATALDSATPGVIPIHIYEYAVKGFAAYLTPEAKRNLEQDPRVASITPDVTFRAAAPPSSQTVPRGITRSGADVHPVAQIDGQDERVDVDIAIIDSGIDAEHPDLNVFFVVDCVEGSTVNGLDETGHGTHVAGTAAALDNGFGVVGVAPGARIWSFRVLNQDNAGTLTDIVRCIDLVTRYAAEAVDGQTIDVANMSISGEIPGAPCGALDAFHEPLCRMVAAGVTTVVAAGNNARDAADFAPGNNQRVITVSALADSDGLRGGLDEAYFDGCLDQDGPQPDDSLATFSNYGADVDIAAPGVGVLSTWPTYFTEPQDRPRCVESTGPYGVTHGTSMASPHVAGAAGLLLAQNPNLSPDQVRATLVANREQVVLPGDPDGINEGVLNLRTTGPGKPPKPPKQAKPGKRAFQIKGARKVRVGQTVRLRVVLDDPSRVARVVLFRCQPGCRVVARDTAAPYVFEREPRSPGRHKYKVRVYDKQGKFTEETRVIVVRPKQRP